ncbi:MAG: FtsX-like permease family protein [Porticoccaceae bacterium]|nr:FtsX-like permease family protein [Porticoccaceae bacterium]MDC0524074.1 FtsX-like permease family protein [Porticoccaceae bacterium]MDG1244710.1 FtsX-like permease family protein [Porticoccaceae bacterium]
MFKPVSVFIGLRYFFSGNRSNLLVSFISLLAIAGLVLGVALLVIVLSVMNGFDRELRNNILSVVPHVQLIHQVGVDNWQSEQQVISQLKQVTEATPYNEVKGLLNRRQLARPIQLLGLSSELLPAGLGSVLDNYHLSVPTVGQLLLSEVLAEFLNVEVNQSVSVIIPSGSEGSTKVHPFTVSGIFATHTELDQSLAIASLEQVAQIAGTPGQVLGFRLQVEDQFNARNIGFDVIKQLPFGYGFRDWFQTHGNLYQAIQLSRNLVGLLIFLIVAIAAFNVISMLMMSVMNKRKDIAILQTLGLSQGPIVRLFLMQGSMIGFFGISIGVILGIVGCYWIADLIGWLESLLGMTFLDTSIYPIDYIPVDLRWGDVTTIAAVALVLNVLATIYPALRASRTVPAEELRYE